MRSFGLSIVIGLSFLMTVMAVAVLVDAFLDWIGAPNHTIPGAYWGGRVWGSIVVLIVGAWLIQHTWKRLRF